MEIQEQNLCLSHPSSELLLPRVGYLFSRGQKQLTSLWALPLKH